MYNDYKINLIPLSKLDYYAWKEATLTLLSWIKTDNNIVYNIKSKTKRITMFEQLKALYKSFII
jgi:hypothetical protein